MVRKILLLLWPTRVGSLLAVISAVAVGVSLCYLLPPVPRLKSSNRIHGDFVLSPDGRRLVVNEVRLEGVPEGNVSIRGSAELWNLETGEWLVTLHEGRIHDLLFWPDSSRIIGRADEFSAWDAKTGQRLQVSTAEEKGLLGSALGGRWLHISLKGKVLLLHRGASDWTLTDLETNTTLAHFEIGPSCKWPPEVVQDQMFTRGSESIDVWDLATMRIRRTIGPIEAPWNEVSAKVDQTGRFVIFWVEDQVLVWDVSNGKKWSLVCPGSERYVGLSADGRWMATIADTRLRQVDSWFAKMMVWLSPHEPSDAAVELFDVWSGAKVATFDSQSGYLSCTGTLVVAGSDGFVYVYDVPLRPRYGLAVAIGLAVMVAVGVAFRVSGGGGRETGR